MNERLTIKEASEMLGLPQQAIRILIKRGKLPIGIAEVVKTGGLRTTYYIQRSLVIEFLKKGYNPISEHPVIKTT